MVEKMPVLVSSSLSSVSSECSDSETELSPSSAWPKSYVYYSFSSSRRVLCSLSLLMVDSKLLVKGILGKVIIFLESADAC